MDALRKILDFILLIGFIFLISWDWGDSDMQQKDLANCPCGSDQVYTESKTVDMVRFSGSATCGHCGNYVRVFGFDSHLDAQTEAKNDWNLLYGSECREVDLCQPLTGQL